MGKQSGLLQIIKFDYVLFTFGFAWRKSKSKKGKKIGLALPNSRFAEVKVIVIPECSCVFRAMHVVRTIVP